jgi:hypothetical protein
LCHVNTENELLILASIRIKMINDGSVGGRQIWCRVARRTLSHGEIEGGGTMCKEKCRTDKKKTWTYQRYIWVSFVWPSLLVQFGSLMKEVVNQEGRKKGVASIVLSTTEHGGKAEGETRSLSLTHELFNQRCHWPINSEALL